MPTSQLMLFDDQEGHFGPMTDLRAVFDLRTGVVTTRRRVERVIGQPLAAAIVPDALVPLTDAPADLCDGPVLLVNGRWTGVSRPDLVRDLPRNTALSQSDGSLVAAHLEMDQARRLVSARQWQVPANVEVQIAPQSMLMARPWHILDQLEATLLEDLRASNVPVDDTHAERIGADDARYPLRIAANAVIAPMAVFDTTRGPIVIDDGAQVHAFVSIQGPCYVGPRCVIGTHTSLRPNTVIGPICKVSGEVSHTVFDAYSNKAHQGFVGHTLVGRWCNLGADTNVSNLKNTYGSVRMQLAADATPELTGRNFLGPVVGDYVRTGICTRLNSGAVIGTGAMIAQGGYLPKFIDCLTFLTDQGHRPYDIDRFVTTVRTMMKRRDVELSAALETRLRALAIDRPFLHETGA